MEVWKDKALDLIKGACDAALAQRAAWPQSAILVTVETHWRGSRKNPYAELQVRVRRNNPGTVGWDYCHQAIVLGHVQPHMEELRKDWVMTRVWGYLYYTSSDPDFRIQRDAFTHAKDSWLPWTERH